MRFARSLQASAVLLCLLIACLSSGSNSHAAHAVSRQNDTRATRGVRVETVEFKSELIGAPLPYVVVLPSGYDDNASNSARYPVLYLLHGLGGKPRNWLDFDLAAHAAQQRMIFVLPDGRNGFYADSASAPTGKYESYVMRELIPDVDRRFRTLARREGRAVVGLSMGGYGALKFGVKYPEQFFFAGSMSGALAAASYARTDDVPASFRQLLVGIFGAPDGKTKMENDLFRLVRELTPARRAALPFLYLDCGTEDFLFASNRLFVETLTEAGIRHEYRQLPGGHTGRYWSQQLPEVIEAATRTMNASPMSAPAAAAATSAR